MLSLSKYVAIILKTYHVNHVFTIPGQKPYKKGNILQTKTITSRKEAEKIQPAAIKNLSMLESSFHK